MLKKELRTIEIEQELEWLLQEYEAHMLLHKMKISRGLFETVITGAAEFAEDLVKVKWSKLAQSLFAISHRKIELLEAERNAPGRELAYVSLSNRKFPDSREDI